MSAEGERGLFNDGRYLISPNTTATDLLEDASCWVSAAESTVTTLAMELCQEGSDMEANPRAVSNMLFGVTYLLRMTEAAISASNSKERMQSQSVA